MKNYGKISTKVFSVINRVDLNAMAITAIVAGQNIVSDYYHFAIQHSSRWISNAPCVVIPCSEIELKQDIKEIAKNSLSVIPDITAEDFLPNLEDNYTEDTKQAVSSPDNILYCKDCKELIEGVFSSCPFCGSDDLTGKGEDLPVLPSLDLQLFAGGFKASAPSHILYACDSEEYILRSFFDRPMHNNCKNSRPDYIRQSGKNQDYLYIAGPFWSKNAARDILDLADYFIFRLNYWAEDLLQACCNCSELDSCNSYIESCGKSHDSNCPGGKMEKIFNSCIRHDGMMKKLKKVLEAKGIVLFKDWSEFGTSRQKMVWWIER